MPRYTVKTPIKLGKGKRKKVGESIDLDVDTAAELIACGAIEKGAPKEQEAEKTVLLGSDKLPAEIEVGAGLTISQGDLVKFVVETGGGDVPVWNGLTDSERGVILEGHVELLKAVHQAGVANKGKNPTVGEVKKILGGDIDGKSKDAVWAFLESQAPAAT